MCVCVTTWAHAAADTRNHMHACTHAMTRAPAAVRLWLAGRMLRCPSHWTPLWSAASRSRWWARAAALRGGGDGGWPHMRGGANSMHVVTLVCGCARWRGNELLLCACVQSKHVCGACCRQMALVTRAPPHTEPRRRRRGCCGLWRQHMHASRSQQNQLVAAVTGLPASSRARALLAAPGTDALACMRACCPSTSRHT